MTPSSDLSETLTADLYSRLLARHYPWLPNPLPEDGPPFKSQVIDYWFNANKLDSHARTIQTQQYYDIAFHTALLPISRLISPNIPPEQAVKTLMAHLPAPTSKEFPEQALGLVLLLDQAPRGILKGANRRYLDSFFGPKLCIPLCRHLLKTLPIEQRADNLARWTDPVEQGGLGYDIRNAIILRIYFYAPLFHSDSVADLELGEEKTEQMRSDVEAFLGVRDANRNTREADKHDPFLFRRLAQDADKRPSTWGAFVFWFCRLFEAKTPIVRQFGHVPYRNAVDGREENEADRAFLEAQGLLGRVALPEEDAAKIMEDVKAGVWTPMTDQERPTLL
ncbi:hypothetical protein K439DRAFT_1613190 [Ramaria rubella]|nr:hypothetical protein K439DRAFT_1613190 [Ramaria rubella]